MLIGEQIHRARISHNLTLKKLGSLSGVNSSYIGKIERDDGVTLELRVKPTLEKILKIARVLNLYVHLIPNDDIEYKSVTKVHDGKMRLHLIALI